MRRLNSSVKVDFISEKGIDGNNKTYFAYVPLENMVCYAIAESYDDDSDLNSAKLAVESVLIAFERNPSLRNLKSYIQYAHNQIVSNSVKNKLETAITVIVSDYTRIRYAVCGNIKFYLLSEDAFYLKGETQTYFQFTAREYGYDKADVTENKNLLQYLGKNEAPRPYVSKNIILPEESTMLLTTCNLWERVDDVEILDVYEESKPEEFVGKLEELFLLTQLENPAVKSYSVASMYVEKTFKEDTVKKKKRRRRIIIASVILIVLAIIAAIVVSIMRMNDRRAMSEIERLNSEGIRYSNYGNYSMAFEQYDKARELTWRLRNNWQYRTAKRGLSDTIAERWHLFNSIITGNRHLENGNFVNAQRAYRDAQIAYYDVYRIAGTHTGLLVSEILSDKLTQVERYITVDNLVKIGEMYEIEELYREALAHYREAEIIVIAMGDLTLRKNIMSLIFEAERKMNNLVEVNFIRQVRALMLNAENELNYGLALQYVDFIIEICRDLRISDTEAQVDRARIIRKTELERNVTEYYRRARAAEADSRYNDAIRDYEMVLELYGEMEISIGHERYRNIMDDIVRVQNLIEEIRAEEEREREAAANNDAGDEDGQ
jgi:serine/threonine protein phosphatase PrpC